MDTLANLIRNDLGWYDLICYDPEDQERRQVISVELIRVSLNREEFLVRLKQQVLWF